MTDKLDIVFSEFIRRRDCPNGVGRCISCGSPITFSTSDCGHFIARRHISTRFNEKNCATQCRPCNRMEYGNLQGFTIGLIERYGDGVIEELKALSRSTLKLSRSDYEELIKTYKTKIHENDFG